MIRLLAGEACRGVWRVLSTPLRWGKAALIGNPQSLSYAPQDIRTADPTIADDVYAGYFAFAGKMVKVDDRSPFEWPAPSPEWSRELHGFSWLRHMRAADTALARMNAHALIEEWLNLAPRLSDPSIWQPEVAARRLMIWLSQSPLILEQVDLKFYNRFMRALGRHMRYLARCLDTGLCGLARLQALIAITETTLCAEGLNRLRRTYVRKLMHELNQQILRDGGHISRNPAALIELMLDLLPLRQLFIVRGMNPPDALQNAMDRVLPMLRMFRHSNGTMALFHGMGAHPPDFLATLFAYEDMEVEPVLNADLSGYQRREAGPSVLIMDTGLPPPRHVSAQAHASALSFEFSSGGARLICNCGAAQAFQPKFLLASRLTAAHSTLVYDNASSARFLPEPFSRHFGPLLITGPEKIGLATPDNLTIVASHDGYRDRNILHRRTLALSADGLSLNGVDEILPLKGNTPPATSSLRFHLEPLTEVQRFEDARSLQLTTSDGQIWLFNVEDEQAEIEESIYFADPAGIRRSLQIAVHSTSSCIVWRLHRLDGAADA